MKKNKPTKKPVVRKIKIDEKAKANAKKAAVANDIIAQVLAGVFIPTSGNYVTKQNLHSYAGSCEVCAVGAAILEEHLATRRRKDIISEGYAIRNLFGYDLAVMNKEAAGSRHFKHSKYFEPEEMRTLEDLYENTTGAFNAFGSERALSRKMRRDLGLCYNDYEHAEDDPEPRKKNAATLLALYALLVNEKGNVKKMADKIYAGKVDYSKIMPAILKVAEGRRIDVWDGTAVCDGLKTLKDATENIKQHKR